MEEVHSLRRWSPPRNGFLCAQNQPRQPRHSHSQALPNSQQQSLPPCTLKAQPMSMWPKRNAVAPIIAINLLVTSAYFPKQDNSRTTGLSSPRTNVQQTIHLAWSHLLAELPNYPPSFWLVSNKSTPPRQVQKQKILRDVCAPSACLWWRSASNFTRQPTYPTTMHIV